MTPHPQIIRPSAKSLAFIGICLIAATLAGPDACDASDVVFVNLSGDTVYVARQDFDGGGSGLATAGPGQSSGVYEESSFVHTGWFVLGPGDSYEGPAEPYYYVEGRGQRELTWPDQGKSLGVVRPEEFRGVKLFRGAGVPQRLLDQGFRRVNYRRYAGNTRKVISGTAYRIESTTIPVNIQSRSFKGMVETYRVPGRVVDFSYDFESRWADFKVSRGRDYVYLGGVMEGEQVRIGGPREHAYVRGRIEVNYTVRN